MLARVYSCAVIGLEGVVVEVEVDTGQGLPSITIVGSINRCRHLLVKGLNRFFEPTIMMVGPINRHLLNCLMNPNSDW